MFVCWAFVVAVVLSSINGSESRRARRMVGGEVSYSFTEYPYIVPLQFRAYRDNVRRINKCGGILISDLLILTAAHCISDWYRPGTGRRYSDPEFDDMFIHENFTCVPGTRIPMNDIAILKLSSKLMYNNYVQPIKMFEAGEEIKEGSIGKASGWGHVPSEELEKTPTHLRDNLRSIVVPVMNTTFCAKYYEKRLPPGQICAGSENKHTCKGDSGGPLVVDGKLAGIASWRKGDCDQPNPTPDFYTEVAYYRNWIDEKSRQLLKSEIDYTLESGSNGFKSVTARPIDLKKPDIKAYTVHLQIGREKCSGAIISDSVLVTTASCALYFNSSQKVSIRAGSINENYGGTTHRVASYSIHENYTLNPNIPYLGHPINDVAVIVVEPPFSLNPEVKPIQMAKAGKRIARRSLGTVSSWGHIIHNKYPLLYNQLTSENVRVEDDYICPSHSRGYPSLTSGQLCVGNYDKDVCQGEFGGPLVVDGQLVGIASTPKYCSPDGIPVFSIYTDVAYFRNWIEDKIQQFVKPVQSA